MGHRMLTVRSRRVREARALRRRATRDKRGQFLAEGPQAVREAITRPELLVEVFATPDAAERNADLLAASSGPVHVADEDSLAGLSETLAEGLGPTPRLVAVLVDARDPGNAGTVIRCADATGADTVILACDSVDPHGGKCVRATAGSLFHLPVVSDVTVSDVVSALRERGVTVLAADGAADADLDHAADAGLFAGPTAWLFGNEARGFPDAVVDQADQAIRVPIYGRAESLNLATAAAVCLYTSARAHRARR